MGLRVERASFANLSEVLDDVKLNNMWPTTFVSGPSKGLPEHWHDYEVHAYVMEGDTWFVDGDTGKILDVTQGDKVVIPGKALHAEGELENKVVYIVAITEPLMNRDFLAMRTDGD